MAGKVKIIATVSNDLNNDRRMIRTCEALQEAGYDCLLVGRKRRNSRPLNAQTFKQLRLANWFEKGPLFYAEHNLRIFFFLLFHKADIVISVDLDTIFPAVLVKYLRRYKLVYDAHEYFTEVPEVVNRKRVQSIWERIAGFSIPKVDMAYSVGPILASVFTQKYKKEFGTVRNCPNADNTDHHMKSSNPPYLLYQGALNKGRCVELYIKAMHKIPEHVHLKIAGSGDLDQELVDLMKSEGLEKRVHFLGMLDPSELSDYTSKATIGLNLLENEGLSYYYSLANKCLDYIQAGLPSIHSKFPEYEAIKDEYDCLELAEITENDLVAKINLLLSNPERYHIIQKNCKIAAAELNWENEKKELLRLYEGLA